MKCTYMLQCAKFKLTSYMFPIITILLFKINPTLDLRPYEILQLHLLFKESIDILEDSLQSYDMKDNNKFKTLVVFDCRGLEPTDFSPRNGWKVVYQGLEGGYI